MQVTLVKFIENNRRDAAQLGIGEHLAEQNSLRDKQEPRVAGRNIIEADLVADLAAEFHTPLAGDTRRQHPRGQAPRLQDHATTVAQDAPVEEDLGNLGGFSRAGRGFEDETVPLAQRADDFLVEFVNGQRLVIHSSG